jgi:hypothetical protein
MYVPPQADTTTALKEIHWTLCKPETTYPEAAFIAAGDFNKENLRLQTHCLQYSCYKTSQPLLHSLPRWLQGHPPPSPANQITTPFYSSFPIGRNSNREYPCSGLLNAGLTNRNPCFKVILIMRLGYVPDWLWEQH